MEKTVLLEQMDGLMAEQVIRDHDYSMYSRHFHESYELYILLEGERYYFIDRETYLVKAGMAVMVSRNQIHKTSMAGDPYHDRMLFQMDGDTFDPYLKLMGEPSMNQLFERLNGVVEYDHQDWERIRQILEQLRQEIKQRKAGFENLVRLLVVQMLIITSRYRPEAPYHTTFQAVTPKHQKIREVTDYLLKNFASSESQEQLAGRFYVSKSYLCRIFKEVTGFTLNEYLNLARVRAAGKLLSETKLSVTEIAARTGFESVTYFERVFKKHTGERPLQYRKNCKSS